VSILRQISTTRLIALCGAVLALAAGGAAIASALGGGGPIPPSKPLANAIHDALAAPPVQGITARIQFTNHLIDASSLQQGSNPLLAGATGRLWLSSDHRLRLELQSQRGDSQLVIDNGSAWFYDASSNTVYRAQLPQHTAGSADKSKPGAHQIPSLAEIQKKLDGFMAHAQVSGALPSDVAHKAAYTVRVSPRHDGGLLGAVEGAWDATHGVPLRVAVYAQGDPSPVLELKATHISFGPVAASDFAVTPPAGAKVVDITQSSMNTTRRAHAASPAHKGSRAHGRSLTQVSGTAAVQAALPFHLSAPDTLVGLPRHDVRLITMGKSAAALVTYGQGLGGIAVLERVATPHTGTAPGASSSSSGKPSANSGGGGGDQHGASLPSVSIGGTTGHELSTALGTLITFTRGGVGYVVVGSVPANAAEAAARGL
jgi:outer membrane lipoprotein-sorting protein